MFLPVYDTTDPQYIQDKQNRLALLNRCCTILETEGTQQYQYTVIQCHGCNQIYRLLGHRLFRRGKGERYPGCERCNQNEKVLSRRAELLDSGKEVYLLEFTGTQKYHTNVVRCLRCGSSPYSVNGRNLFQRDNPVPGCDTCTRHDRAERMRLIGLQGLRALSMETVQERLIEAGPRSIPPPRLLTFTGTQNGDDCLAVCGHCDNPYETDGDILLNPTCSFFGCTDCSNAYSMRGTSRPEAIIGFELGQFLPGYDPTVRRVDVDETRYNRVDIFLPPNIIIEFDGAYWHYSSDHDRTITDEQKSAYLASQGYFVIRIREGQIPSIPGCENIQSPVIGRDYQLLKSVVNNLLLMLIEHGDIRHSPNLESYIQQPHLLMFESAMEWYESRITNVD